LFLFVFFFFFFYVVKYAHKCLTSHLFKFPFQNKSKKPKKGKMFKVDSKMLGFSVMSAPDRINVGDRDYAEGV
jgi:hypothetical protein